MKQLTSIFIIFMLFVSCQSRPDEASLIIYQPIASHTSVMSQNTFFQDINNLGFNAILLSHADFSTEILQQSIPLAHTANLMVLVELEPSNNLENEISQWISSYLVDGFVLNNIDSFSDKERARLMQHINKKVKVLNNTKKLKKLTSPWGSTGYLIGRSHETQRELFVAGTFGVKGKRKPLDTFINTLGTSILEQTLHPDAESPAKLNLFHNIRNLYGERAVAVTLIPPVVASNSSKSAPLLWFAATLPEPFIYSGMLSPQQDSFLQSNLPAILALRHAHPALQHGKIQLLGNSTTVYSDLVRYRSEQVVRVINFGNERTILNLTFVSNVIRGKRLVDLSTGEVIERVNRGFRIPVEAGASRLFIAQ